MFKTLTLTYLTKGAVYNENRVYTFENENLGTLINIAVPEDYKAFTFVMDCNNGTVTKQIELGTGETSYSFSLDDSLTVTGTLELQLWATILNSQDETVKVQWEKYTLTINDALNISEITAESNPDIIATHTAQIADLYNITSILDTTGDGRKYLSNDGTYNFVTETIDYNDLGDKPKINSVELIGNKSLSELGIQAEGDYLTAEVDPNVSAWAKEPTKPTYTYSEVGAEAANSNIQDHITNNDLHLTPTEKTNVGKLVSTGDGSKYLGDGGNYTTVSSGTMDYDDLSNKPSINSVELSGNKTSADLGLQPAGSYLTIEVDPTVPAWAKESTKPTYTASEVGAVAIIGDTMTGDLTFEGAGIIDVDYIDANTGATSSNKVGRLRWNNTDKCWEYDASANSTNQIGQEAWARVRNETGSQIDNGTAVYITGAAGNRPTVAKAQANSESTSLKYLGLTTDDIPHNEDGFVTVIGTVRGVNTNSYTAGDVLYLSDTVAGGFRTTRPDAPNTTVVIGMVKVKSGTGQIAVQSRTLPTVERLSNVYTSRLTSADTLKYSGTRWENSTTDVYKTYAGFVNRTDSTLSVNASGVVTLAPAVTSFTVYVDGTKKTLSNNQTVTVTSDQTITYVYLDSSGVLQKSISAWDITSGLNIPVGICFKDASTYALTDERHGHERNKAWHNWAHLNIGAMYKSGLTATFTTSTLSVSQGIIYDEDLQADTGSTRTKCSLWYRNATTGMRLVRGSNYAKAVSGGGILQYDNGSGTLQDVTNNRYATNWVYATNDPTEPIYCVVGQGDYSNLTNARNASAPTINLSTAEWKLIYRVIYQRTTGTPAGSFVEAADFRTVQTGVPTSASTTDHNALINRDAANSHPASAISYDNGSDTLTNVQSELDLRINKTYTLDILTSDWSTNSFAQTITGLLAADIVIVQAPDTYYIDYGLSYTQSSDTIIFTVTNTPLVTLSLSVAVVKAVAGGAL
jgi:hypothetical protein